MSLPDERATAVADLLADLMHYCTRWGIDFEYALGSATTHFVAEVAGEDDPPLKPKVTAANVQRAIRRSIERQRKGG